MNALLAPHRRVIWVTWLIAALLFLLSAMVLSMA